MKTSSAVYIANLLRLQVNKLCGNICVGLHDDEMGPVTKLNSVA
jgi:hypothetical protein